MQQQSLSFGEERSLKLLAFVILFEHTAAGDHAFAYQRGVDVCVVVPRLTLRLQERGGWGDTSLQLPGGDWADVFTGSRHTGDTPLASLLSEFPVAVLERI